MLHEALASLAAQTWPAVEVLVVDARGAGEIRLPERCGSFPLQVVSKGQALQRAPAANAGLEAVAGELVSFLDEDDWCDPEHLHTLAQGLLSDPRPGLAYVGMRVYEQDGGQPARVLHLEHSMEFLFDRNYLNLQAAMFRSEAARHCRFDERFEILEDWDFFLQLAQRMPFRRLNAITANYRGHLGTSGTGAQGNRDTARLLYFQDLLHAKWAEVAAPLRERTRQELAAGLAALRAGDWRTADRLFQGVLRRNPHEVNALNFSGMMRLQEGDPAAALSLLRRAVAIKNDAPGLLHNFGLACEAAGEAAAARAAFLEALRLDPGFAPARLALRRHLSNEEFNTL